AEVSFAEWTPDGSIRHGSFEGLRTDKAPTAVRREMAMPLIAPPKSPPPISSMRTVKISNPERIIDARSGLTKLDLVRYYEHVAEWILPHLKGRPTSLVRGPEGIAGQLFFQKHGDKIGIRGIR